MANQPNAKANTVSFTDKASAIVKGKPCDQLVRQADAIQFEFENDEAAFMEGKDGDLLIIFSTTCLGELILRFKPSAVWLRETLPECRGEVFGASFTDKNGSTRFVVKSNFCTLTKWPQVSRGAPDLNPQEVRIKGSWNLAQ